MWYLVTINGNAGRSGYTWGIYLFNTSSDFPVYNWFNVKPIWSSQKKTKNLISELELRRKSDRLRTNMQNLPQLKPLQLKLKKKTLQTPWRPKFFRSEHQIAIDSSMKCNSSLHFTCERLGEYTFWK